jgi:hypothetical protein
LVIALICAVPDVVERILVDEDVEILSRGCAGNVGRRLARVVALLTDIDERRMPVPVELEVDDLRPPLAGLRDECRYVKNIRQPVRVSRRR